MGNHGYDDSNDGYNGARQIREARRLAIAVHYTVSAEATPAQIRSYLAQQNLQHSPRHVAQVMWATRNPS